MNTLTRTSTVVAAACVAVAAGGAVALAAFSPVNTSTGEISSCYSQKNGALRVVAPGAKCAAGEAALLWAQRGPTGLTGAAGPTGPAGTLSCADELRIQAAVPAFAVTPACAPTGTPTTAPTPAAITLTGFTATAGPIVIGSSNVAVATITLSAPVATDTTVTVTSSAPSVLTVANVTIPVGQSSAVVQGNAVSVGTAQLTATLGSDTKTASVTVSAVV